MWLRYRPGGDIWENHAHKKCTRLLTCVSGKIQVSRDDRLAVTEHLLDKMSVGLLVPPSIWAKQKHVTDAAVLMVLCVRGYEADDYLRNHNEFKKFIDL